MYWKICLISAVVVGFSFLFFNVSKVEAGQICAGVTQIDIYNLGCSVNSGSGYCRVDSTTPDWIECPLANCTSPPFYIYRSRCRNGVTRVGRNDPCTGNFPTYQTYGSSSTTQCYMYCNENNWSACSAPCGTGTQTNDCGTRRSCNTQPCCTPVNGDWSAWGVCVNCSQSRTCTNPAPSCGGSDCLGSATQSCGLVDGGWTAWGLCIGGVQTRTCTNPAPLCGGTCIGSAIQSCALNPWWQVVDGDVSTNGDLYSNVP